MLGDKRPGLAQRLGIEPKLPADKFFAQVEDIVAIRPPEHVVPHGGGHRRLFEECGPFLAPTKWKFFEAIAHACLFPYAQTLVEGAFVRLEERGQVSIACPLISMGSKSDIS